MKSVLIGAVLVSGFLALVNLEALYAGPAGASVAASLAVGAIAVVLVALVAFLRGRRPLALGMLVGLLIFCGYWAIRYLIPVRAIDARLEDLS